MKDKFEQACFDMREQVYKTLRSKDTDESMLNTIDILRCYSAALSALSDQLEAIYTQGTPVQKHQAAEGGIIGTYHELMPSIERMLDSLQGANSDTPEP